MTATTTLIDHYAQAGLHFVRIHCRHGKPTKGPSVKGWNLPHAKDNPHGYTRDASRVQAWLKAGDNVGLALGPSCVLSFDIDDQPTTREIFTSLGLPLDAWFSDPARVEIRSGKPGKAKLLFRVPDGEMPPSCKLEFGIGKDSRAIFELRHKSGEGHTLQDVLPPSIHPDTRCPYELVGDVSTMPEIPPELLALWRAWPLEAFKSFDPAYTPPLPTTRPRATERVAGQRDPIAEFNATHDLRELLQAHGYRPKGRRYLRPGSESGIPGLVILPDGFSCYSHGADTLNDGHRHDAFDVYRLLGCGGDWSTALAWNEDITRENREQWRNAQREVPKPPLDEGYLDALGSKEKPKAASVQLEYSLDDEFIPIGDFIAAPPDNSYLVKGVLPASGLGQVFGCSHVGKSFVLIDLACHVALGWDWHGCKVKKAPVLYVAAEGVAGLKLRFRAWFQAHNVDPPKTLRIRTIPADLTTAESTKAIAERMARLPERPGLVVLDTFATNYGPGSENDAEDMNAAIAGLRTLQGDGLILTAHHTGHSDKTRSRGHSSLFAALDVELQVTQDADKRIKLGHTKLRDGDRKDAIATFELQKVPLPWADVDGDPLNSAVLVKTEAPEQTGTCSAFLPASQRIALEALKTALMAHGVEDKGIVSVAEDQWRKAAYEVGISSGDTDRAKRQAFQRAKLDLIAKQRASSLNGRFWIPAPTGTNRNKPEHVPQCSAGESVGGEEQTGTSSFKGCSVFLPNVPPTAANDQIASSSSLVNSLSPEPGISSHQQTDSPSVEAKPDRGEP